MKLSLPIIKSKESIFELEIPTTGEKFPFRRMNLKDEKILLMAKESSDSSDIFLAINQVIQNCAADPKFNILDYYVCDVEYLFLNIRGQSVSSIIELSINDDEDNKEYRFNIDISKIKVENLKKKEDFNISLTDNQGVIMKYPKAELYNNKDFLNSVDNAYHKLIISCIDKIYDIKNSYSVSDYSEEEMISWLESLELVTFKKIDEFVSSLPTIRYKIEYQNSLGTARTINLATLSDFFMLH